MNDCVHQKVSNWNRTAVKSSDSIWPDVQSCIGAFNDLAVIRKVTADLYSTGDDKYLPVVDIYDWKIIATNPEKN